MFGISPEKLILLIALGFVLLGPEKLPEIARDAARMLRTLRDLSQNARRQLTSELGPEMADFDFNSLNPRVAIRNALFSDDQALSSAAHLTALQRVLSRDDDHAAPSGTTPSALITPAPLGSSTVPPFDSDAT